MLQQQRIARSPGRRGIPDQARILCASWTGEGLKGHSWRGSLLFIAAQRLFLHTHTSRSLEIINCVCSRSKLNCKRAKLQTPIQSNQGWLQSETKTSRVCVQYQGIHECLLQGLGNVQGTAIHTGISKRLEATRLQE